MNSTNTRTEVFDVESALCRQIDPELWFPERGGHAAEAKRLCKGCPLIDECREFAIANEIWFGVWGGQGERARAREIRARRRAARESGQVAA